MTRLALAAAAGALAFGIGAAQAQTSPLVGHWQWNGAASKGIAGEPKPKAITLDISAADASQVAWSITITDPQGGTHPDTFTGTPDGQAHPVPETNGDETLTMTVGGGVLTTTYNSKGGQSESRTCTVSPDAHHMSCSGTLNDGHGHTANYIDVYDRA